MNNILPYNNIYPQLADDVFIAQAPGSSAMS